VAFGLGARRRAAVLPLGSLEKPKDVAGVVSFLTSERARWIAGENM
jgi:NAD(P)-dependent dehydrogenase (short-subunit alcohol dehydrogenase family)